MSEQNIKPERITKPIQLLAVWLIGLIAIETSLLTAAGTIQKPDWLPVFFAISAVSVIPFFLVLIFLLQTKYRPQIQEDEYYSKYLDKNTMQFIDVPRDTSLQFDLINSRINEIVRETQDNFDSIKTTIDKGDDKEKIGKLITKSDSKIAELEQILKFGNIDLNINKTLSRFHEIREAIRKMGFNNYKEFGEKESPVPDNFLVSFTNSVNPLVIKEVLIELIPLGAAYINLVSENEKERKRYGNTIFVGSYLYNNPENVSIDQKLLNKIASLKENSNLKELIGK